MDPFDSASSLISADSAASTASDAPKRSFRERIHHVKGTLMQAGKHSIEKITYFADYDERSHKDDYIYVKSLAYPLDEPLPHITSSPRKSCLKHSESRSTPSTPGSTSVSDQGSSPRSGSSSPNHTPRLSPPHSIESPVPDTAHGSESINGSGNGSSIQNVLSGDSLESLTSARSQESMNIENVENVENKDSEMSVKPSKLTVSFNEKTEIYSYPSQFKSLRNLNPCYMATPRYMATHQRKVFHLSFTFASTSVL